MNDILKPIEEQLTYWIGYQPPKSGSPASRDNYRKKNDLDCILTGGNLLADTIFSLWLPLRLTLVRINGYGKLNKLGAVKKDKVFLTNLKSNLPNYLPPGNPLVEDLSRLFTLGRTRANVMILPDRNINSQRGLAPYYDYMPHFLHDSFKGENFGSYFDNDDENLSKWIKEQHLTMFFKGGVIEKNEVKDLAGTNNVKNGVPGDMATMLRNYIDILEERSISYK